MLSNTPLHYATIGTLPGLACRVGDVLAFFPCEGTGIFLANPEHVMLTALVPPLMKTFLIERIVEPRLAQLGVRL
jgi:hypothetical protein